MNNIGTDYILLVFLVSLGIFQIAAAHGKLQGLSFFSKPTWGYIFGALCIIAALCLWFCGGAVHNPTVVPKHIHFGDAFKDWSCMDSGGDGEPLLWESEIAGFFFITLTAALLFTLFISSVIKSRTLKSRAPTFRLSGLEMLKEMSYFQAISRRLKIYYQAITRRFRKR
jgi:hypothetical protein